MLRSIWLTMLMVVAPAAIAFAVSGHTMVSTDGKVHISYSLEDKENAFINGLLDHARAGDTVRVNHTIVMNPVKGWVWGDLARVEKHLYVAYSLFDDRFSVGEAPNTLRTVTSVEEVRDFILSVQDVPLIETQNLRTGDEYRVEVSAIIETAGEKGGWLTYLPLNQLFRKELHEAFYYIAR
jgi:hypothetical protein